MFESMRVLRSRNYALLWWSGLVSDAGTWMQAVAIGALVTELTDSAAWGGLVAGSAFLASGLITPFGGVIADRHDRRRLLLIASVALAVVSFLLAAAYAAGWVSPGVLLITVIAEGALVAVAMPARGAMLPDLVGKDQMADAAALGGASWNLGRTIGPALAGAVIAWGSYTLIFVINAVSFLLVAIAMFLVRMPPHHVVGEGTLAKRLRDGWDGARSDTGCWSAIRLTAITATLVSPFIALMPAMAQLVFDGTAVDTAHFTMAQGIGSVFGALLFATFVRRFGRHRVMIGLLIALPLSEMFYAVTPTKTLALLGSFFLGATYIAITVGMMLIVQLRSPVALRARVLSLLFMTLSLFYPLGAAIQGRLGDLVGIREVLFFSPALYLVVLAVIGLRRPQWFRSLDGPAEPQAAVTAQAAPAS